MLVPAALAAALVGCGRPVAPPNPPQSKAPDASGPPDRAARADDPSADVGNPLFPPGAAAKAPPPGPGGAEPIVIPGCSVQYEDRQVISAEVDGTVDLIATPFRLRRGPDGKPDGSGVFEHRLPNGTVVTHDPKTFDPKKADPNLEFIERERQAFLGNPEKWVPYWRVREGDTVARGQILCLLDDALITGKMEAAAEQRRLGEEGYGYAKQGVQFTQDKLKLFEKNPGAFSKSEELNDRSTLARFQENMTQNAQSLAKAEADLKEAKVMLSRHRIASRVDGVVRSVAKRPGEFVRGGEKVFEVQSTEKVRLEGNLDIQYYGLVKRGMAVTIEPAVPSAPVRSHTEHRAEVAGVAVTGDPARPLVVSAGLDGSALVWEPNLADPAGRAAAARPLPHPAPVRCVACTPPGAKTVLVVTGADDGRVRVWDLGDPAKVPTAPARDPADFHLSAVAAAAVSPDGKYAATAAGREVFVWDLAAGRKLYALPPEHRDGVTSLAFTPQCELVTGSKDRTLKKWRLGADKAACAKTLDHRAGAVDALGVSPDGGRVLFDQDKARVDLVDLGTGQTTGQLANSGPGLAFATVAAFAPDAAADAPHHTVVTAGGEGDLKGGVQVWHAPRAGGRGSEVARFFTPNKQAGVTCAAFGPHPGAPFLAVGTDKGTVHVWVLPAGPARRLEGRVTNLDSTDPRYVTVRVEMDNKDAKLLDRSAAAVIIPAPGRGKVD
jgi:WD40 repeat protein